MFPTTGQTLKAARASCGLTQKEVAERAFGDASYQSLLSRWEADVVEPSLANLRKLAPIVRLSLGDFTLVSSGKSADVLEEEVTNA
ncbi:helix-turn-helix domain-containing protein [Deinococcus yunweiensis]|uniref:helix-turn-helix domain-containing protein n=1 Tax=Deinococcus yunweiensis TaxID=367282 RepID=UPI00398ED131